MENSSEYIAKIKDGIAANDAGILESEAHSLKGAVDNFCAKEPHDAAYHLEVLGRDG